MCGLLLRLVLCLTQTHKHLNTHIVLTFGGIMPLFLTFISFNIHSYNTIIHSFIIGRGQFSCTFIAQQGKTPRGAEPRIEMSREPTELRRTLVVKCPTLGVRAAARAAVCGEQGLLRDGGGEPRPPLLHCLEPPLVSHILMLLHNVNQHNVNVT
jgi:hypothetical protein